MCGKSQLTQIWITFPSMNFKCPILNQDPPHYLTNISWLFSVYVKRNLSVANQTKGCMYLIYNFDGLQNQLRPIEWCHYIFLNFASHFICFRMFFNWAPYLSVPKYFRYLLRGWIEQISIGTQVRKGVRVNLLWQFKIFYPGILVQGVYRLRSATILVILAPGLNCF